MPPSMFRATDVYRDGLGNGIENGGMLLGQLHQLVFFLFGNIRVDIEGDPDFPIKPRDLLPARVFGVSR